MIHKTNIFAAPIICGAALALAVVAGCSKQEEIPVVTGFPEDGVVRIAANAGDPLNHPTDHDLLDSVEQWLAVAATGGELGDFEAPPDRNGDY